MNIEQERAELLPCPFCGRSVSFHQDDEECRDGCHYIECKTCGTFDLSTAADPTNTVEDLCELRAKIAPLWNRRAALQSQQQDSLVALKQMQRYFGKWPEFVPADENQHNAIAAIKVMNDALAGVALQSQDHPNRQGRVKDKLFCDMKTDEEKAAFFLSGRGYETGVIAAAIQNDVAMAYHRCAEYKKELEVLQSRDREDAERIQFMADDACTFNTWKQDDGSWKYRLEWDHGTEWQTQWFDSPVEAIDHARRAEGGGE